MSEICQTLKEVLENPQVKSALNAVKTNLPETIEIQKELVLIEAPTGHEETRSKRYKELLESVGLTDVESDEHNNVWGWIRGSEGKGNCVLLEGHLDTVFSFGDVKEIIEDEEGKLHCPGICDDTRAIAANLAVAKALIDSGIKPFYDIVIGATVCEEGLGGMRGMKWILEDLSKTNHIVATVSIDGPTAVDFYANATGMVDWDVIFSGPGGHAWTAFKTPSAIHAAARSVAMISDLCLPEDPKTTITVSLIEGGQAIHGIAQKASFKINARSNSQVELNKLNEELVRIFHLACEQENAKYSNEKVVKVSYEKILDVPAGNQDDDALIIQATKAVTAAVGMEANFKPGGCTNTNMSIAREIPAVTLGRGGREFGTHTLAEWFDPKGVYLCEQKSILMLMLLAGLTDVSKPIY
ncbi:M20/M25/M40 family metallo-hydrolase [uncultured Turicimonas sp.]|uniref:M20/M25/M40 family metallo-hydrolase n=1 Tax=uncultured Turicimonas sp. TaxID=1918607 RepID=UPI00280380F9|nr:M20/M25/M40 family metallo-hydrolase [uncultured Turicimonas sp.]